MPRPSSGAEPPTSDLDGAPTPDQSLLSTLGSDSTVVKRPSVLPLALPPAQTLVFPPVLPVEIPAESLLAPDLCTVAPDRRVTPSECAGEKVQSAETETYRSPGVTPPEEDPECDPSLALPATRAVIQDDMFFVNVQFQIRWTWSMIHTGASLNLMSLKFFEQLFHQPVLRPPGPIRIVADNGASLDLKGWATLVTSIGGHWLFNEFGIVNDMPLDAV